MKRSQMVREVAKEIANGDQQRSYYTCNRLEGRGWICGVQLKQYYAELFGLADDVFVDRELWSLPRPEQNNLRVWMLCLYAAVLEEEGD